MFEKLEIAESIYEVAVEPSYKNLIGCMPTVLVTADKREDNLPRHRITLRSVRALASAENDM